MLHKIIQGPLKSYIRLFKGQTKTLILLGLHTNPGIEWVRMLNTKRFARGAWINISYSRLWWFPLKDVPKLPPHSFKTTLQVADPVTWSNLRNIKVNVVERGYHFTKVENLMKQNKYGLGNGILKDGFLRNGDCTHLRCKGVNFFSTWRIDDPLEQGMCCIVISCVDACRLKKGQACRHCVKGPPFEANNKVAMEAIIFHELDVPSVVVLSNR